MNRLHIERITDAFIEPVSNTTTVRQKIARWISGVEPERVVHQHYRLVVEPDTDVYIEMGTKLYDGYGSMFLITGAPKGKVKRNERCIITICSIREVSPYKALSLCTASSLLRVPRNRVELLQMLKREAAKAIEDQEIKTKAEVKGCLEESSSTPSNTHTP